MVLDIIIGIIVVFAMVQGFRNGFVYTFIHMVGWLLAVVLGFVWSPYVRQFLLDKTDFYDSVHKSITVKLSESMGASDSTFDSLPTIISNGLHSFTANVVNSMATSLADTFFTIMSFIVVVIAIKLILWVLMRLLSKRNREGFTSVFDGILGLLSGFVKGMILIFILLAIMVPILGLASADFSESILKALDNSYIAKDLYDNNLILLIVRDFVS